MRAVRTRLGEELRARWKPTVGFALLIGIVAGTVLATVAGARRTETAYDRYLEEANAEDVVTGGYGPTSEQYQAVLDAIAAIDQADSIAVTAPMVAIPDDRSVQFQDFQAGTDGRYLYEIDRPRLLAGRLPDPDRVDEVFLNRAAAAALGLEVGDRLTLRTETAAAYYAAPTELVDAGAPRSFTVTGIGVLPGEVVPIAPFDGAAALVFTPAYLAAHPDESFDYTYLHARLDRGAADVDAFRVGLSRVLEDLGIPVAYVPFIDAAARQEKVNRSIRPQAQALLIFGVMLAVVGFLVLSQLLTRHLLLDEGDRRRLWGLGFTRGQLLSVSLLRVLVVLLLASAVAVAVAVAASARFPIGPARIAERHPGMEANVAVLGFGVVALILVFLASSGFSVARSLPRFGTSIAGPAALSSARPSRVAAGLAGGGAPPTSVVGVRMALERGHGPTALPVVGALVATALALGALTAAFTFGANLQRLVSRPSLYGLEWDVAVGNGFTGLGFRPSRAALDADPDVASWSAGNIGELRLAGTGSGNEPVSVAAIGVDTRGGDVFPRVTEGRALRGKDEIVLGADTARRLGVVVGDSLSTTDQAGDARTLEVVGTAVLPGVGRAIFDSTDLDEGAVVRAALLADPTIPDGPYTTYFVRYHGGVDQAAANARLRDAFRPIDPDCQFELCIVTDQKPGGIRNYDRVQSTPLLLAGVLALLAVATLATTLATSVRRRRRDFAVLEALGFVRRQVAATTAWQATTVAVIALLIGLPLGVAGGRALWTLFSDGIGVSVPPRTPVLAVLGAIPVTILLANAIAVIPGRLAARTNAARVLRSE